jgi:hypothetical protein
MDMTRVLMPQSEEGNQKEVKTSDIEVKQLLVDVLAQLKILNFHMSLITDMQIEKGEVE